MKHRYLASALGLSLLAGVLPGAALGASAPSAAPVSDPALEAPVQRVHPSADEVNTQHSELDWLWIDQSAGAGGAGVAANGDAYTAGGTGTDAAVRKHDRNGNVIWTRTLGAGANALVDDVTVDDTGVYVAGMISGGAAVTGQSSAGGNDAFLIKIDLDGNVLWRQQWGTAQSDYASGVATDRSGVYVYGQTTGSLAATLSGASDVFVRKLSKTGGALWTYQFGTSGGENAYAGIGVWNPAQTGTATDAGIYVSITTTGAFPTFSNPTSAHQVAIVKLDLDPGSNGIDWVRQFGAGPLAMAEEIGVDEHGAYLVGVVGEALPGQTHAGSIDSYIRAYEHDGDERWTRQFGTPTQDWTVAVSSDGAGIYLGGYTDGSLPAQTNAGGFDAFLIKYRPDGTATQLRQFGTAQSDRITGVGVDLTGCYATGILGGSGFTAKLNNIPAPPRPWVDEQAAPSAPEPPSQDAVKAAEYQGDPVNVLFGNFTYQHTDLSLPGVGLPVSMTRTYNSAAPADGLLGHGWSLSYNLSLRQERPGVMAVSRGDGRVDRYFFNGSAYVGPAGSLDTFGATPGNTFTLTTRERISYRFNWLSHATAPGRLISAADSDGNQLSFGYDGSGRWVSITDAAGRIWSLTYSGARVASITDPAGRTVDYAYNASGDLVSVADVMGRATTFEYDASHRMTRITDARGKLFVSHTYDAEGRVVTQTDAAGTHTFAYLPHETVYTDPLGNTTNTHFDSRHRITKVVDAMGGETTMAYNAAGLLASTTDQLGRTTSFTYDARGNVLTVSDPTGAVTTNAYDSNDNLISVTDHLGRTTTHGYDGENHLVSSQNALGQSSFYTYTANGLVATAIDALGQTTSFGYDSRGYQTQVTNPLGQTMSLEYDVAGRLTKEIDALGRATLMTYDAMGNLLTVETADGATTSNVYDASGNRTKTTDARGNATNFTYNNANRLTAVTNALGQKTTFGYDALGRQVSESLPNGKVWRKTYDALGRLKTSRSPLGFVTSYFYDAAGQLIRERDALGNETLYEYDGAGRITRISQPLGTVTTLQYDAVGNLTRVMDALGRQTNIAYDDLNRVSSETDPLGGESSNTYDPAGRLDTSTNPAGQTTGYEYDAAGRLIRVESGALRTTMAYDAVGNRTSMSHGPIGGAPHVVSYVYNNRNLVTQVSSPQGNVSYAYDLNGNRTSMTQPGLTLTYTYDTLDRLTSVKRPGNTVAYAYNNIGLVSRQTFGNGAVSTHTYDADGRLTKLVTKKGTAVRLSVAYTLDALGRRTRETSTGFTGTYGYDALGRLISATQALTKAAGVPAAQNLSFSWTYDKVGNRTKEVRNGTTTNYTYNAANRLVSAGARSFTHDGAGRLTADGLASYAYDAFGRLSQVVRGATTTSFSYDGDGNRLTEKVGATTTTFLLDRLAPNPAVISATTGASVQRFVYGLSRVAQIAGATVKYEHGDGLGSVRLLTAANGAVSGRHNFEPFGKRINGTGLFGFAGEAYSNGGNLLHLRAREYDPTTGRFLTPDPHASDPLQPHTINRYQYVGNSPTNAVDPSGRWSSSDWELQAIEEALTVAAYGCDTGKEPACADLAFWSDAAYKYYVLIDWEKEGVAIGYQDGLDWMGVSFGDGSSSESYVDPGAAGGYYDTPAAFDPSSETLIGMDGSSLIGMDGSSLISDNGLGLISEGGGALVGMDGSSLIGMDGSSLVSDNGLGLISEGGGALVGNNGNAFGYRVMAYGAGSMGAESSNNKSLQNTAPGY